MANGVAPDDNLADLRRRFAEARDLTAEARRECEIDDDYLNGFQWTPQERRQLALRKQPDLVFNRVRPAVYGMLGVLRGSKTDPRAFGRNPEDDQTADVATKVLQFLGDKADFHQIRMDVAEDYLVRGIGAVIVEGTPDGKVPVQHVRWEEFFYDPRSRRRDFKDARYLGIAKWVYADTLKRLYPEAGDVNAAIDASSPGGVDPTFQDRPVSQSGSWYDRKLRRVMLVEMYYNDTGTWERCVFYSDKVLEAGPSPYKDDDGKPGCPIEAQTCYVDRDNNRFGVIRDMRGPQDEFNKRRSKLLHILNNRQVFAENEIALHADAKTVRDEAARPDGVLPLGWKPVAMTDVVAAQLQMLELAGSEIERQAPNPAILGRLGNEESGKAQLIRQQSGLTELAVVLGGVEQWEVRCYRQMWARAKQFWTAPDYVRVTDDTGSPQFVGINQPVHEQEPQRHPVTGHPLVDQQGNPLPHPQTGQPMTQDKVTRAVVAGPDGMPQIRASKTVLGYKNALAELDVDITVDIQPHSANIEAEQFTMLVELRRSGVPIDPMLLIQASSLPGKYKLIQAMQEQAQQPNPQAQLQQADMQATIQDKQASAAHRGAQAQHLTAMAQKTQVETAQAAQAPHNAMFQAGLDAGVQQAQFAADHALQKQELVAKQLQMLGDWQAQRDQQQAKAAANS